MRQLRSEPLGGRLVARLRSGSLVARPSGGHEYTESNLRFAAHLEPSNGDVDRARDRASELRAEGKPTVGTTLDGERRINPFLRVRGPEIRATLSIAPNADDVTTFAAIRRAKDAFR